MLIDTHCHLENKYYDDVDLVINNSFKVGVEKIIVSGCEKESIDEVLKLIDKHDNVYATVGFHPDQVFNVSDSDLKYLESLLDNKKIVGIGEIGLDYHYDKENKNLQIELFEKQLKIAEKYDLPVVIHSRDATFDTINTLKKYKVKGVIHCFSGSLETANIYLKMGFVLGIGGVVTFKNSNLKDVLKEIPLSKIVLETDSPYLAPVPYRGELNSPVNIPVIADFLSKIYNVEVGEVGKLTTNTTISVYKGIK